MTSWEDSRNSTMVDSLAKSVPLRARKLARDFASSFKITSSCCAGTPTARESFTASNKSLKRAEQFARATCCLVDDWLELAEHNVEIFHRLLRQLDAIHDEQDTFGVSGEQEAADERGTKQCLACAGGHFEQELATRFVVESFGDGIHRADLVAAQRQVGLE